MRSKNSRDLATKNFYMNALWLKGCGSLRFVR